MLMKYEIVSTGAFDRWFARLKDIVIKRKILARFARVENGNFGDSKHIGDDLFELRFFFGGGLRVYYTVRNEQVVLLLIAGDKSSQSKDIEKAKQILNEME